MCEGKFKSEETLRDHISDIHSKTENLECNKCGEKFQNDKSLMTHNKTKHDNKSSVQSAGQLALEYKPNFTECKVCKEKVKSEDLKNHLPLCHQI